MGQVIQTGNYALVKQAELEIASGPGTYFIELSIPEGVIGSEVILKK